MRLYFTFLFLFLNTFLLAQNLSPVEKDDLWGYQDEKGKLVIPYSYSSAFAFQYGIAVVHGNIGYGLINEREK